MQLIIGGGLSGIELAQKFSAHGIPQLVLERCTFLLGSWVTLANDDSKVQVDPVTQRPLWDLTTPLKQPQEVFETIQPTKQQFIENQARLIGAAGLHKNVLYLHELVQFRCAEDGRVVSTLRHVRSGDVFEVTTAGLHIRTGSLSKPVTVKHPHEDQFKGVVRLGISNDLADVQLKGKKVVVIGSGPQGFENVEKCIRNEAEMTTWLCRRLKIGLSEQSNQLFTLHGLDPKIRDDEQAKTLFNKVYHVQDTLVKECENAQPIWSDRVHCEYNGEQAIRFLSCQVSGNMAALQNHQGVLHHYEDEIQEFQETGVRTKEGREIECDVVIKCLGFHVDNSFLQGHQQQDFAWVDGRVNVSTNTSLDHITETVFLGPVMNLKRLFTLSYFICCDQVDNIVLFFMQHPQLFQEFIQIKGNGSLKQPSDVSCAEFFGLAMKVLQQEQAEVQQALRNLADARVGLLNTFLSKEEFLRQDQKQWETRAKYLSKRTGKEVLEQPFKGDKDLF